MCQLFSKKKTYLLTWSYCSAQDLVYTDIIKARNISEMWKKHKENHPISTFMVDLKEI